MTEEQSKLLADLTMALSPVNSKLDEMHQPVMERSVKFLQVEVGDLHARIIYISGPP
jgi:hypothetical protein